MNNKQTEKGLSWGGEFSGRGKQQAGLRRKGGSTALEPKVFSFRLTHLYPDWGASEAPKQKPKDLQSRGGKRYIWVTNVKKTKGTRGPERKNTQKKEWGSMKGISKSSHGYLEPHGRLPLSAR